MTFSPDIHHRRSIRLKDYDYSSVGAYFVTICVLNRECLFGDIVDGEMKPFDSGKIVETVWGELPERFPNVEMGEFIVMPNHFHGIIILTVGAGLGPPDSGPPDSGPPNDNGPPDDKSQTNKGAASRAPTLGDVICAFKSISTIRINRLLARSGIPIWQRNYHERVIRNEAELNSILEYIRNNPINWPNDKEQP